MGRMMVLYRKYGIFVILVLMCVVSSLLSPVFLTGANLTNVVRQISITTIIACAMTMLIICGMIDLSSGSVVALSGCIGVSAYLASDLVIVGVLAAVLVGGLAGFVNGFVITRYSLPPFIVTLAMMSVARGLAYLHTEGKPIINIGDFTVLGQSSVLGIPIPVIVLVLIIIITWVILTQTKLGRYLYGIGGNEEAAVYSGIDIKKIKVAVFVIAGLFTGLSGAVLMGRLNAGLPTAGEGFEFDAITAVIIGGTSFKGGVGNIFGTIIGALMIGVLNNILNLMNVSSFVQQVVKGVIIVLAVVLDVKTRSAMQGGKTLVK